MAAIGAPWILLQTAAWTAMLADNLRTHSLTEAVTRTFDGKHPCCVCKAIAAGKKSQKKNEAAWHSQKLEFPPAGEQPALFGPSHFNLMSLANSLAESRPHKPPLPPPRGFCV